MGALTNNLHTPTGIEVISRRECERRASLIAECIMNREVAKKAMERKRIVDTLVFAIIMLILCCILGVVLAFL